MHLRAGATAKLDNNTGSFVCPHGPARKVRLASGSGERKREEERENGESRRIVPFNAAGACKLKARAFLRFD